MKNINKSIGAATLAAATALSGSGAYIVRDQTQLDGFIAESLQNSLKPQDPPALQAQKAELARAGDIFLEHLNRFNGTKLSHSEAEVTAIRQESDVLDAQIDKLYPVARSSLNEALTQAQRETGIYTPISLSFVAASHPNIAVIHISGNNEPPRLTALITTAAFDAYTNSELRFALQHEIRGHVQHEYTDESGRITPNKRPVAPAPARQALMGLETRQYEDLFREERADREAIATTCDPASAASLLAKDKLVNGLTPHDLIYALDKNLPINGEENGIREKLVRGMRAMANLPKTYPTKSQFAGSEITQAYPEWRARIQQIRDEADKECARK